MSQKHQPLHAEESEQGDLTQVLLLGLQQLLEGLALVGWPEVGPEVGPEGHCWGGLDSVGLRGFPLPSPVASPLVSPRLLLGMWGLLQGLHAGLLGFRVPVLVLVLGPQQGLGEPGAWCRVR